MNFRMPLQLRTGFRGFAGTPAGFKRAGSPSGRLVAGDEGRSVWEVPMGVSATGFLMAIENFLSIFSACLLPADPPACCLLKVSRSTIISSYVISPRSWACTISCICSPKVGTITNSRAFASSIASDRSTANSWSRRRERSLMPKLKNPRVVYLTF